MENGPMGKGPSARADLLASLVWLVLGAAIVYGSWTMDRLEHLNINPYTAPGLVPGVLGGMIVLAGLALLVRSVRAGGRPAGADRESGGWGRFALALLLCVGYGAGLLGRGLPFWLATALFVTVFIFLFEHAERKERGQVGRGALLALVYGLSTAGVVTFLFEDLFLVRLP